jgi:hypothetical protein
MDPFVYAPLLQHFYKHSVSTPQQSLSRTHEMTLHHSSTATSPLSDLFSYPSPHLHHRTPVHEKDSAPHPHYPFYLHTKCYPEQKCSSKVGLGPSIHALSTFHVVHGRILALPIMYRSTHVRFSSPRGFIGRQVAETSGDGFKFPWKGLSVGHRLRAGPCDVIVGEERRGRVVRGQLVEKDTA